MTWVLNASPEINGQSTYPRIVGSSIAMTVVMVMVVCLRAYVRIRVVKNLGQDDYIIFFCMLIGITYTAIAIVQTRYGLGLPPDLRPPIDVKVFTLVNYAGRVLYYIGVASFKVALCVIYLRMTTGSQVRIFRIVIWAAMALTISSHIVAALVLLLRCKPAIKNIDPSVPGTCFPTAPLYYGTSMTTIVCDIILFLLPIPLVLQLQLNKRRKYGLIFAFSLGILTTMCSIFRITQVPAIVKDTDPTGLIMWAVLEIDVGIITTSLVTLGPLVSVFKNAVASHPSTGYRSKGLGSDRAIHLEPFSKRSLASNRAATSAVVAVSHGSQEKILSSPDEGRESADAHDLCQEIRKTTDIDIESSPRIDFKNWTRLYD